MNNAEILDNWDQIGIIKRNIFRVVQARQQNLDPAEMNQVLNSKWNFFFVTNFINEQTNEGIGG